MGDRELNVPYKLEIFPILLGKYCSGTKNGDVFNGHDFYYW